MTNVEFLNDNFGTNYKRYDRCRWSYSDDLKVWMIAFDGRVRYGWKNEVSGTKIIELFVEPLENQISTHRDFDETYRLVVDKEQNYKILGVYKYDEINSDKRTCRIWEKVAISLEEFLQK